MLNAVFLNTEEFLLWVGKGQTTKSRRLSVNAVQEAINENFCALIFPEKSSSIRSNDIVIVIDRQRSKEFYAFLSTYVIQYVPFTAFFRVITADKLNIFENTSESVSHRNDRFLDSLVGVAIAEAALYLRLRGSSADSKTVTLAAATATYSAAILQGLVRFKSPDITAIGKGWSDSRSFLGSEALPLPVNELSSFWDVVSCALLEAKLPSKAEDAVIVSALRKAISAGSVREEMLDDLFSVVPELRARRSKLGSTREEQARSVQEIIAILGDSTRAAGPIENCLVGCLLSLLGDGSFKFLPSVLALVPNLLTAPLWFGVWAGIQDANDVMTRYNCLGRRLARDIRTDRGIYSKPVDDISIDELCASVHGLDAINRIQSSAILVEIYPNISSRQRLNTHPSESPTLDRRIQEDIMELKQLMHRSLNVIERLNGDAPLDNASSHNRRSAKPKSGRWDKY